MHSVSESAGNVEGNLNFQIAITLKLNDTFIT
jgi:hypothetical protein